MTCSEQEEDLAPDEASGVLCRCGHLLTDNDLHFCGYCGSVIQVTSARRRAPAAVVSGRRAALAALASERNAVPVEPVTDRFIAPTRPAAAPAPPRPPVIPMTPALPDPAAAGPAVPDRPMTDPPVTDPRPADPDGAPGAGATAASTAAAALAGAALAAAADDAPAAPAAPSATRAARAARAARSTRANRPARVARGVGGATAATPGAPEAPVPDAPTPSPAPTTSPAPAPTTSPAPAADAPAPPAAAPPREAVADAVPTPPPSATPAAPPVRPDEGASAPGHEEAEGEPEAEPEAEREAAPETSLLGRRNWTGLLAVLVILGACAARTALGLLFTYPGYLSWLPVVLVSAAALVKVARFSIGLVGVATVAVTAWWAVDHVVSTARLQALGYDTGQSTIPVPLLVAAVGAVPLAVVLCVLVDRHVRATVRAWVVPRGGFDTIRAAAVVLALLAALFPVVGSLSTGPGFAVLTAARDQVRYPGFPTPGEIADRMHAMSVSKGRPVSMTCTYAPDDGTGRPSYQCVGISQVGGEAAQVHDGIRSTALPDGTYSCVDLTSGVDRRLC